MASRISGFGDIHQGGISGDEPSVTQITFLLLTQWLMAITAANGRVSGEAANDRYIGLESAD
jgi:hypothetical protein